MDIAELKKFEFLRHLTDEQLILLVNAGEIRKLKPGDTLIKAGDKDSWEYFLLAGEVDHLPEQAFAYVGTIEEVIAKAKSMES